MTVKECRIKAGLTQKQLAEKIGCPYQTIQKYENGSCLLENMSIEMGVKYCFALGIKMDDFIQIIKNQKN